MGRSRIHFIWQDTVADAFTTGVSLHSHTLFSRESLTFIERTINGIPWVSGSIRRQQNRCRKVTDKTLDLTRGWWTPPLSPRQVLDQESEQIQTRLGMKPLVSISDHDDISAGLRLRAIPGDLETPISVEWTVPFRQTFFHLGVHNLSGESTAIMSEMRRITQTPNEQHIARLLEWVASDPASLIVFNHPAWDESHVGADLHDQHVKAFLELYRPFLHAVELNGLRSWEENRNAALIAESGGLPLISGGDRHGREPNACLNLTNAASLAEFADEVRCDGTSNIVFMSQYRESPRLRLIQNMADILREDPNHALGWTHWSDRVFYDTADESVSSLAQLYGGPFPSRISHLVRLMTLTDLKQVQSVLRYILNEPVEYVLRSGDGPVTSVSKS